MRLNINQFQREWLTAIITKLLFAVVILIGVISIFIYVFFPEQLEKHSYDMLGDNIENLSRVAAIALSNVITDGDKTGIEEVLTQLSNSKDIEYLVVADNEDNTLSSVSLKSAEKYDYKNDEYKSISDDGKVFTIKRNILDGQDKIGTLYMGLSLDDINYYISRTHNNAIGVGLISLVLGLIMVVVLKGIIASPIRKLNRVVLDIASGDLNKRSEIKTRDEIGELSHSMNKMIDNWESTRQEWGMLNKGLEQRVAERTQKLEEEVSERRRAEEELRFYMARLENSNRELQDFAFVASHDLQEPLRKVQAFGDRLKAACGDELSEKAATYLDRMQSAAGRMQTLIKDLLTFSRVTSKAKPFEPVDMNTIAAEVLSDLEVAIERMNANVEIEQIPNIEADPMQMRQLFQNLIGNALKFHKKDETPVIKVYSEMIKGRRLGERDGREFCQLVFEDNGIGFDEKYTDKIFAVFQRLHGRSEYEGTGLGLAVCRKIVERHGGTITAESKPGHGAKFYITLPATQVDNKVPEKMLKLESPDKQKTEDQVEDKQAKKNHGMEQSFMVPCP